MAYTTLLDNTYATSDGRTYRVIRFSGNGQSATEELEVAGLPPILTLVSTHVSSSVASQPSLGTQSGWTAGQIGIEHYEAASSATSHDETPSKIVWQPIAPLAKGSVYWRHNGGGSADIQGSLIFMYGGP